MKKKQVRKTTKNSPAKSVKDGKSIIKTGVNPNVKNGEKSSDSEAINSADPDAHMIDEVTVSAPAGLERNSQLVYAEHDSDDDNAEADEYFTGGVQSKGVPSIFNDYSIMIHPLASGARDFLDRKGDRGIFGHKKNAGEPTIEQLLIDFKVNNKEEITQMPYYANDFLYCKWYRMLPLNRLITLRRYPYPTYDNLEFSERKNIRPVAQAVTYFGEPTDNNLSDILKINGKINWKAVSSQIWDAQAQSQPGLEESAKVNRIGQLGRLSGTGRVAGALNATSKTANNLTSTVNNNYVGIGKHLSAITGKGDITGRQNASISAARASMDFSYTHKVYGPVNVVKDTMTRDTGIGGEFKFTLVFDYQLKSYANMNPKLVMLDLINNLLALTFFHAKWWGGANRFMPATQKQFGFLGDASKFYSGDYGGYFGSIMDQFKSAFSVVGDAFKQLMGGILSGDLNAIKGVLGKGFGTIMDMRSAQSRPQSVAVHSLVSGAPVGEYHMVIGNPYNPIASVGNLIMESFDITFPDGTLGFDDFPDTLRLRVNMKKARALDSGDWQSMLALGYGRTYVPEKGIINKDGSKPVIDMSKRKKTRAKTAQEAGIEY